MRINTKFDIGDKVWFVPDWGNEIKLIEIDKVEGIVAKEKTGIVKYFYYEGNGESAIEEKQLFIDVEQAEEELKRRLKDT